MNPAADLFDPPGPRGRRRLHLVTAAVSTVIAAAIAAVVWEFGRNGQLAANLWTPFGHWSIMRFLVKGLKNTLIAGLISAAITFPLGALAAMGRLSRHRALRLPVTALIEFFRAMPLLLLLFFFVLVLPLAGIRLPVIWQLMLSIIIYNGAVTAEVFRAGILAIPAGQTEAGMAIGLSHGKIMRLIILPQTVRVVLPQLIIWFIRIVKDTTLGYIVTYPELLESGKVLGAFTGALLPTYIVVAAMFAVMNLILARLADLLQRYLNTSRRASGRAGAAAITVPELSQPTAV